jgi:predicted ArsR family transcriptional regulator
MLSFVVAISGATVAPTKPLPEFQAILDHARDPVSVAELASRLDLALGVVRVLLDDMTRESLISIHRPAARAGRPDDHILRAVINGIRAF